MLRSLTHFVLRVETADRPITGAVPVLVADSRTTEEQEMLDELASDEIIFELIGEPEGLDPIVMHVHACPPRFFRWPQWLSAEKGEEMLREEGVELRICPQIEPLPEPTDMEAAFASNFGEL